MNPLLPIIAPPSKFVLSSSRVKYSNCLPDPRPAIGCSCAGSYVDAPPKRDSAEKEGVSDEAAGEEEDWEEEGVEKEAVWRKVDGLSGWGGGSLELERSERKEVKDMLGERTT